MKTFRILIIAVTSLLAAPVSADGIEYLVVENTDASTTEIALTSFNQIKFSDTQMLMIGNGTTAASFPLKNLQKMYFGPTGSTGIDTAEWDATGEVEIYSTSGILLQRGAMDFTSLPSGIYIVRQGNRVMKVNKK